MQNFFCGAVSWFVILGSALMVWAQSEPQKSAPPLPAISCTLSSETQSWQPGKPAIVAIELKNDAGMAVDLDVVPYLDLYSKSGGGAYTSPVDIIENHALGTTRERVAGGTAVSIKANPLHLHLDKEASVDYKVDATKTRWDLVFSAKWPSLPLFKVVAPGIYNLTLKLWVDDESLECNTIEIRILKVSTAGAGKKAK